MKSTKSIVTKPIAMKPAKPLNPLLPASLSGLALSLGITTGAAAQAAKPLNVVLIISDQMSARALPLYGNPTIATPNMDRLAREGVMFNNAVCSAPYCSPTRSSIVTGCYPVNTGVISNVGNNQAPLSHSKILTESLLFAKGYVTGHFGKWHLGELNAWPCYADKNNARATDDKTYFASFAKKRAATNPVPAPARAGEVLTNPKADQGYGLYQTAFVAEKLKNASKDMKRDVGSFGRLGTPPELYDWTQVTTNGVDFIKSHKDAPFMVTISLSPPHPTWAVPDPWYGRVDPAKIPFPPSAWLHPEHYLNTRVYKVGQYLGEEGTREKMRCYYAMCLFVDDMIGRVLKTLDDCNLADNTLVVFVTDHGDPLNTQGMLFGKTIPDFLEEKLHIPTLMRLPGRIPAGKKITASFSSVDIAPTIRDYTGVNTAPTQGRSFRALIEGAEKDDKGIGFAVCQHADDARCIRGEVDGKLYFYSKIFRSNAPTYEQLYDLTDDPWQMKDLSTSTDPATLKVKARLMSEYDAYATRNGDIRLAAAGAGAPDKSAKTKKTKPASSKKKQPPDKKSAASAATTTDEDNDTYDEE